MFRRFAFNSAAVLGFAMAVAPGDALARAGAGTSSGSRGSQTYSAPPSTGTATSAAPVQRSMTPQTSPSRPAVAAPAAAPFGSSLGGRSPFMAGLMGGLLGAGIGGLLFGGGMFHGMSGFSGFFGFLIQIFLVVLVGRLIWGFIKSRRMQPAMAGGPQGYERTEAPGMAGGGGGGGGGAPQANVTPVNVTPADYHAFEETLHGVQAAWSAHDLGTLRQITSPEMASYFAEQMTEQKSSGVVNTVTDVHLEKGDLSEAWGENGREYATVAMRFSMIDVTRDGAGRVVDDDPVRRSTATEFWTFLRTPGGRWILSAIQQAR